MDEVEKIVRILRKCDEGGFCDGCDYKGEADSTGVCMVMSDAADMIERLSAELGRVKKERDAAVQELADLEKLISPSAEMCSICKYAHCEFKVEPCASCEPSHERSKWEWRGVCKENSGGTV